MNKPGIDIELRVVVAIEPRSYSEAIGCAIQSLRPNLGVEVLSPDALSSGVRRYRSDLVLCGQSPDVTPGPASVWVEYRPYTEPTKIRVNGEWLDLGRTVELSDLLKVIDDLVDQTQTPTTRHLKDIKSSEEKPRRGDQSVEGLWYSLSAVGT